jgi:hypothetical protein
MYWNRNVEGYVTPHKQYLIGIVSDLFEPMPEVDKRLRIGLQSSAYSYEFLGQRPTYRRYAGSVLLY